MRDTRGESAGRARARARPVVRVRIGTSLAMGFAIALAGAKAGGQTSPAQASAGLTRTAAADSVDGRDSGGRPVVEAGRGAESARDRARDTARVTRGGVVRDSARGGRRSPDLDPITAAAREYERTGVARTIEEGAFLTVPYGHAQPTVTCAPLRACVIELEAGEGVLSKIAGDTQRWEIQLAVAGADGRTPLIVVKPHDCGLTTNLVLATSAGRIYDLILDSPPCPRSGVNPHGVYVRHVRFYYPDAMVQTWAAPAGRSAAPAPPTARVGAAAEVDGFNFAYRVQRDRRFPWVPVAVFDDGAHCYIKLPDRAAHRDAPVLFALADDGTKTLLNYSLSGDTYVTDRVFRSAVLIVGEGGHERAVRLENLRYDAVPAEDANEGKRAGPMGGGR